LALGYSLTTPQNLLEISTRPYLYELTQKYGREITKLSEIPDEILDDWEVKGFQWIWFMGVWQVGQFGIDHDRTDPGLRASYDVVLPGWTEEDVIGSPYAIVKYELNTELGTAEDLATLREKLHSRGMKLMLDFVPNHSAFDCDDVTNHMNYYIRAPEGSIDPNKYFSNGIAFGCGEWCDPWTDVAQYNYFDPEFRTARIETLKHIAGVCDGLRCDMSHLILNSAFGSYWATELAAWGYTTPTTEFWADSISAVKAIYPDFIFMAEAYGDDIQTTLHNLGFDYSYDKEAIDQLVAHDVSGLISKLKKLDLNVLSHFTENHDEPRSMATFWNYAPASDAASAALLSLPGVRLVFQDQWYGFAKKLDVHLRRAVKEDPSPEVQSFFNSLFTILKMDSVLKGTFTIMTCNGGSNVLTWRWVKGDEHVLFCVNFGESQQFGSIICDDAPTSSETIPVVELMSGTTYYRNPAEMRTTGLNVILDAYQVQVFKY
jgi:hypothetical protein